MADPQVNPSPAPLPMGVLSILDTDLYKLTIGCAVLKYYKNVKVTYRFINRTPDKRLSRKAFNCLREEVLKLSNLRLTSPELAYLQKHCPYLTSEYFAFLAMFRFAPDEHLTLQFHPVGAATGSDTDIGDFTIDINGLWTDTIMYEIPLLALTSEAYFRYVDTDWDHIGQEERAFEKGKQLLQAGCIFSEFGTRRRRDYHTQAIVISGLKRAAAEARTQGWSGQIAGTSNVHMAMRFGLPPVGTIAHEWFMGIAALTDDYTTATEEALCRWFNCYRDGSMGIALTDTFGTPAFLRAFRMPIRHMPSEDEDWATLPESLDHRPRQQHPNPSSGFAAPPAIKDALTYAEAFAGVRQDSGNPLHFISTMERFYREQGITEKKVLVFSDALTTARCIEYRQAAKAAGFRPTFGIGTFFTNDFVCRSTGEKSAPMNIVIKLSSAAGKPAIKLSDNISKNTGNPEIVLKVKQVLGYVDKEWEDGNESARWGRNE